MEILLPSRKRHARQWKNWLLRLIFVYNGLQLDFTLHQVYNKEKRKWRDSWNCEKKPAVIAAVDSWEKQRITVSLPWLRSGCHTVQLGCERFRAYWLVKRVKRENFATVLTEGRRCSAEHFQRENHPEKASSPLFIASVRGSRDAFC